MTPGQTNHLIQITSSGGWGGRESLPLAIHRCRLKEGLLSTLVVGKGSRLAEETKGVEGVSPVPSGRLKMARATRRILKSIPSGTPKTIVCHFTRDLPSIRAALIGDSDTPLYVVKHVSPGRPKHDMAHRFVYKRVTGLLAVSEFIREKCERVYPIDPERTAVWHPGVDIERFYTNSLDRERIRTENGCTPDAVIMGYVARITPNKGLEDLVDATAQLQTDYPNARLWIAGSSSPDERDYEEALHDRIAERGITDRVHFFGWLDRPEAFLSALDLFVVPSRQEAFGLSTVEAMACYLPVVGFRAAGTAEIVTDLETGLLADPNGDAPANLANTIRLFLEQPERLPLVGLEGRRRAETYFSLQAMLDRLHELIQTA